MRWFSQEKTHFSQFGALDYFLVFLSFVSAALLVSFSLLDYDAFWHLANGRAMFETGSIVNTEIFSFTNYGKSFNNHEWLSQLILFAVYDNLGVIGLVLFKVLLTLTICFILFASIRNQNGMVSLAAFLCWLAVFVGLNRYLVRPQIFSFLGVVLLLYILFGYRNGSLRKQALFFLPPLMVLWDFLHGAIYGLIILVLFLGCELFLKLVCQKNPRMSFLSPMPGDRLKQSGVWIGLTFLAMLLSPFGLLSYDIFIDFVSGKNLMAMTTAEFQPTPFSGFLPFWFMLGLAICSVLLAGKKNQLSQLFLLVAFAGLAIRFQRGTAVFCLVAVPIIAYNLTAFLNTSVNRRRIANILLTGAIVIAAMYTWQIKFLKPWHNYSFGLAINEQILPMGAARFVKESEISGKMFNSDRYGGLFSFFLFPKWPIFHYNHHKLFEYSQAYFHNPDSLIEKWKINFAVVGYKPELDMFRKEGFVPVYWEAPAAVLIKDSPENKEIIDRYRITYFRPLLDNQKIYSLASNPAVLPTLAREISDYLSFKTDIAKADILGNILTMAAPQFSLDKRIDLIGKAEKYNGKSAQLLQSFGILLYQQKKLTEAASKLAKALQLDKRLVSARLNLAYIKYDQGDYPGAVGEFAMLLKGDSKNADALYGSALSHYGMGEKKMAAAEWQTYLQIVPQGPWAQKARGFLAEIGGERVN